MKRCRNKYPITLFLRIIFTVIVLVNFATCKHIEQKLDGAYENVSASKDSSISYKDALQTITLFRNGYWITTSFTKQSFVKCCGGTYRIVNGDYIQKFDFNFTDTSLIGKEDYCKYYFDNKYLNASFIIAHNNKKSSQKIIYEKIKASEPLKNTFLEGVWIIKSGQAGYSTNNREVIRIFAYPCFANVTFNYKEKKFITAYCGIYQFDGKNLIETIQYSYSDLVLGSTMEWDVKKQPNNEIRLFDIDSFNDEEIYDRSNDQ